MLEAFRLGGWGMWFILVFGLLGLTAGARFAWRGDGALAAFSRWMLFTTVSSSLTGFLTGMIKVCHYVVYLAAPAERWVILVEGTGEALHCLSFGALLSTLMCLLIGVGYRRFTPLAPAKAA